MPASSRTLFIPVRDYNLEATLTSGQAFRWRQRAGAWEGIVGSYWVRLTQAPEGIVAECALPVANWEWLTTYLQTDVDLRAVLNSFPADAPLRASIGACRGLRLLRQDPWECLASFILSSTKRITQIQQIVAQLCACAGRQITVPAGADIAHAFPDAAAIVAAGEKQLRACKMGFRAPNLWATAKMVVDQSVDLHRVKTLTLPEARRELLRLPGVGPKIADCVLLFGFGFAQAFPVDVWVMKALRQLYFPRRRPTPGRLQRFIATYFGPHAGYAQQYLFHYMRTARSPAVEADSASSPSTRASFSSHASHA